MRDENEEHALYVEECHERDESPRRKGPPKGSERGRAVYQRERRPRSGFTISMRELNEDAKKRRAQ